MCLAIPGKILQIDEAAGFRVGKVRFGDITREVNLNFVPEAVTGDYVLVHVGFAIRMVDAGEAEGIYGILQGIGLPKDDEVLPAEDL